MSEPLRLVPATPSRSLPPPITHLTDDQLMALVALIRHNDQCRQEKQKTD